MSTPPSAPAASDTVDARGNVTSRVTGGTGGLTESWTYAASCTGTTSATCNKPLSYTDPMGKVTNYTYNSQGQVTKVERPAAAAGGTRPTVSFTYANHQAFYKNSAGAIVASGQPVSLLTTTKTCAVAATCPGTANETVLTLNYGPQSAGTPNNLLPLTQTVASGNNAVSSASSFTYDNIGNRLSTDGPLAGTADTTRYRYNKNRELIGMVGPDPDGTGARKHIGERTTYNSSGLVQSVEAVNVNSLSDADWNAATSLQKAETIYDANDRPVRQIITAGGVTHSITLQTAGSDGPDRIIRSSYNEVNQITKIETSVGLANQRAYATYVYDSNSLLTSVTDAENNKTTYSYDTLYRLIKTQYPSPIKGAASSSTTDYEQLTYNARSDITNRRLRNGTNIAMSYDDLGRLTVTNLPGTEPDRSYSYDLLGRVTSVTQTGLTPTSFTYDALSRRLTEAGPLGTNSYSYDVAGRRTSMVYPGGGLTVNYDYDVTGKMLAIRENGATSGVGVLAAYAYDDYGRMTTLTRGNGTVSSYSYDAASRPTSLAHDLAGTAQDITIGMTGYTPSSQIKAVTRSNDSYAYTAYVNVNRSYTSNGRNQYTQTGPVTAGYDARGNLTGSAGNSYVYRSENLMTSGNVGGAAFTMAYDPLLRLYQTAGAVTTRFGYDGLDLIAEYNGSNALQRRYVHGPGADEPLLWYEGSGLTDRRWYHSDERGSVIAVTNGSGAMLSINTYDDFGIPAAANAGRFQYTGQTWLPEIGM
ncbi:MAG: RHS repeat protein [Sphingomonadales bacterium]|nr:RHS repeat protein [Sphingomonadales bacterium]